MEKFVKRETVGLFVHKNIYVYKVLSEMGGTVESLWKQTYGWKEETGCSRWSC